MAMLSFLSYNIRSGKGMDDVRDLRRIAAVIQALAPDCVALQEVDVRTRRNDGQDLLGELAALTGMRGVFGCAMDYDGGQYGVGVLTRRPVLESSTCPLPGHEPRVLLAVTTTTEEGVPFRFCSTHLDLEQNARLISAGIIARELSVSRLPFLLMGDFNAEPGSPELDYLSRVLTAANQGEPLLTHPADVPAIAIDHCFLGGSGWSDAQVQVVDEPMASDHRPLLVRLSLAGSFSLEP